MYCHCSLQSYSYFPFKHLRYFMDFEWPWQAEILFTFFADSVYMKIGSKITSRSLT